MKDNRPVNLDISSFRLPLPAYASITHRITGVALVVGTAVLLWAFDRSLSSPEEFEALRDAALLKFLLWGVLSALGYHTVAGVRHLLMEIGIGESKEGGVLGAKLTIGISLVLVVLLGVWIW